MANHYYIVKYYGQNITKFDVKEIYGGRTWNKQTLEQVDKILEDAFDHLIKYITYTPELLPPIEEKFVRLQRLSKNINYEFIATENGSVYFYTERQEILKTKLPMSFLQERGEERFFKRANKRLVWC